MTDWPRNSTLKPTPFHVRTAAANRLHRWHSWKGFAVSDAYDDPELEYFACRNTAGVFDLSPMSKYRISGPDALDYLDRLMTRDMHKVAVGRVAYVLWCNDDGKVLDDGTVFRLADDDYRLCAYGRHNAWLAAAASGFDVEVIEETETLAALAVQGPTAFAVLDHLGLDDLAKLKPFDLAHYEFAGAELTVSRTGFTGDLGYELWISSTLALTLWDSIFEAGRLHGIRPMGTDALELARIEAGFLQAGTDFLHADLTVRPDRTRSPYELGLGWLVAKDKALFNGRRALRREQQANSGAWQLLKLEVAGNKAATNAYVYARGRQVGFVTSAAWSPVAKRSIAIAHVEAHVNPNKTPLTVAIDYQRELHWSRTDAACRVVDKPFWDPTRRRLTPPGRY